MGLTLLYFSIVLVSTIVYQNIDASPAVPLQRMQRMQQRIISNEVNQRISNQVLDLNPSGSDPEIHMNVCEIVNYWGYPCESHTAQTEDGYILGIQRIPWGKNATVGGGGSSRPVVFLQHGLLCSSSNWITNLPDEGLGFILADAGFDVWMGNFRGNKYSTAHAWLNPKDHLFWEFTWDEMAMKDLPAMINYVLATTGQSSLHYAGHSEGTMTAFALFSKTQDYVGKIKKFFALAPVSTVGYIEGPLTVIADWTKELDWLLTIFGVNDFLPNNWVMDFLAKYVCGIATTNPLCVDILFLIAGPDSTQLNCSRIPVYVSHTPAGTSTDNIVHFGQMVKSKLFQTYNWGSDAQNEAHYGQKTPPIYDLNQVHVPTYLFSGSNDWLADPTDVAQLLGTLPTPTIVGHVELNEFNHLDFIWGMRAPAEVYQPIVKMMIADNLKLKLKAN